MSRYNVTSHKHKQERRNYNREGCNNRTPHATCYHITDISGAIDAYRTRGHLRDCHNIGKRLARYPTAVHNFALNK